MNTRQYRIVTPEVVAKYLTAKAIHGNGSAAVRAIEPEIRNQHRRAWLIERKANELNSVDYMDEKLNQIAVEATDVVGRLVHSDDAKVAGQNARFVIEQIRGKALQRSESKHLSLNIQTVLD